jgi:hypothetical protein
MAGGWENSVNLKKWSQFKEILFGHLLALAGLLILFNRM